MGAATKKGLGSQERAAIDALRELHKLTGSTAALSRLLEADRRTVERWLEGENLSRVSQLERLWALKELLELARKAHGRHALEWFAMPNPQLRGIKPLTLLSDPSGREILRGLLGASLMGGVA